MRKNKPSTTAYKVAMNVLTLGAKPDMAEVLAPGILEATEQLLIASGAAGQRIVRWARSPRMVSLYKAFDWMTPGQFEALAYRKAFCERQVRDGMLAGATQILVLGAVDRRPSPFLSILLPKYRHSRSSGLSRQAGRFERSGQTLRIACQRQQRHRRCDR